MRTDKKLAEKFYTLIDSGLHPYEAFNTIAYDNEEAWEDLAKLMVIAENLAADKSRYSILDGGITTYN